MKPWLWLIMVLYLAFMGCATSSAPAGVGNWGGYSYPSSWDDPNYYLKYYPN